jgi:hypothetical protein
MRTREASRSKWAACYNSDTMLLVVWPRSIFGRIRIHLVKKLIVHDLAFGRSFSRLPQVGDVDVVLNGFISISNTWLLCRRQCFSCPAEELIHLCVERRDVIRFAAGDQVGIDHDFFIDPLCPRIAQISLE